MKRVCQSLNCKFNYKKLKFAVKTYKKCDAERRLTKFSMEFGKKVKAERLRLGLTQTALGAKIGASHVFISYVEDGLRLPSLQVAKRIAKELGVTIDYLVADEN